MLFRLHPELDSHGSGMAIIDGEYDPRGNAKNGFVGEVPDEFEVRHLGHGLAAGVDPYEAFVVWDPRRVRVWPMFYNGEPGNEGLAAKAHAETIADGFRAAGWETELRSYTDTGVLLAHRSRVEGATASLVDRTSRLAPSH